MNLGDSGGIWISVDMEVGEVMEPTLLVEKRCELPIEHIRDLE